MPGNRRRRIEREDGGFSLVEMLVASVMGVMLMLIVGGFVISMVKTQSSVAAASTAITEGQQTAAAIDRAVRNSATVSVSTIGSDQLLKVATLGSGSVATWSCAYWYYSAADQTLRAERSASAIVAPASTSAQRGWTLEASGVTRIPASGAAPSPTVFSSAATSTGQTLTFSFRTSTGSGSTATFQNSASNITLPAGSPTC